MAKQFSLFDFDYSKPKKTIRKATAKKKVVASAASKKAITTPSGAGYILRKSKSHELRATASGTLNQYRWKTGRFARKRK